MKQTFLRLYCWIPFENDIVKNAKIFGKNSPLEK